MICWVFDFMEMERVDRIFNNDLYREHLKKIEYLERDRVYCRHDVVHFLDVARIALIIAADENIQVKKDMVYAAALLHDIGRDVQYETGTKHEEAGADIAPGILKESGYSDEETDTIVNAIREHGNESIMKQRNLTGLLYRADKLSRKCYYCNATDTCHKAEYKRNSRIIY